jgi:hypothetical protein
VIRETKLLRHVQNSSKLPVGGKLFIQKNKLLAMNFDIPSKKSLICKYIKPTPIKLYQGPQKNTEKQSITADDEGNGPQN